MAKVKLDIDYKRTPEQIAEFSNPKLTVYYIDFAVSNFYKDGLNGQLLRIWGRLQRKLDDAVEAGDILLEIEQAEKDLISKAIEKANYPANLSKFVMIFQDQVLPEDKKDEDDDE